MKNFELSITRALNAARRSSPITYIALRSLIDSCPDGKEDKLLGKTIHRLLQTTKTWHYRNYKIFKEKKDEKLKYRELTIGSPLTLLAETILIDYLQEYEIYNDNPNVYSYRVPIYKNSGQNFSFFMHGYKKRNKEIEIKLSEGNYAYIFDLKKFYPSINRKRMYEVFSDKINTSTCSNEVKKQLDVFLQSLLISTTDGIAANPDFGHICADFYLEEFDLKMTDKFGSCNYYRYVDDIVIIGKDNNLQKDFEKVLNQFLPEGLELNKDKTDLLDYDIWKKVSFDDIDVIQDDFSEFLTSMTIYLALHPKELGTLKKNFIEKNIFLPFEKIFANSQYKRQLRFYKSFFFKNPSYLRYLLGKSENFLENAEVLKKKLLSIIEELPNIHEIEGYERRLLVQKYRFCINRLLVFSGKETLEKILFFTPDEQEFIEIRTLVIALLNNDVSELIQYNGNTILSFCELWKSNLKDKPKLELYNINNIEDIFNSVLTLIIHGIVSVKVFPIDKLNSELIALLGFTKQSKIIRESETLNYYDEVSTLMNSTSKDKIGEFITTRFSDDESIDLDTLKLGRGISSRVC
ncbi:MAG: RNA-directed DNA polymerase [Sulfurimonas sp.]|nr:RNA-directed DNA polymerase [Sulfurimonas sp.]